MPGPAQPTHHLLLVERDHPGLAVLRSELAAHTHLRVHCLNDVVNAIRFLSRRDGFVHAPAPDLIILGLELPYFSGAALLQERRRRPSWQGIPVVVLSDRADDHLSCLALGADSHAVRPSASAHQWGPLVHDLLQRHLPLMTPP